MTTPPINAVSVAKINELRETRLDLPRRLAEKLGADAADATDRATAEIELLQAELNRRIVEVREWDRARGILSTDRTANDLTLANVSSWAMWNSARNLFSLDTEGAHWNREVAQETHMDVTANDPRWVKLLDTIHADVFFIGLNWGAAKSGKTPNVRSYRFDAEFLNFHETLPHKTKGNQFLKNFQWHLSPEAVTDGKQMWGGSSHLWGGYLTDIYKGIPTSNQNDLAELIDNTESAAVMLDVMYDLLDEELKILQGPMKPVLACLGRKAEHLVRTRYEPLGFTVRYVPHPGGRANVSHEERAKEFIELDQAVAQAKQRVETVKGASI